MGIITPVQSHLRPSGLPHFCPTRDRRHPPRPGRRDPPLLLYLCASSPEFALHGRAAVPDPGHGEPF